MRLLVQHKDTIAEHVQKARRSPKLIRKEITVHGPTGVYQRMAWVLPSEAGLQNPHSAQFDMFDEDTRADKPISDRITVTKVTPRQINFMYRGEPYALGARWDNAIACRSMRDGKPWYYLGGKLNTDESYKDYTALKEYLLHKYVRSSDPEREMYTFGEPDK